MQKAPASQRLFLFGKEEQLIWNQVLFFKTTETIKDNINDRDNFFGLTTDL